MVHLSVKRLQDMLLDLAQKDKNYFITNHIDPKFLINHIISPL